MVDQVVEITPDFDEIVVSGRSGPIRHLVLVLHGIFSISDNWMEIQQTFSGRFEDIEIVPKPVSYGLLGPIGLLTGIGSHRRKRLVEERISDALTQNEFDAASIHCHSNGTKVFSTVSPEVHSKFDWVFFAGSICHHDDDRQLRFCATVVNDCGVYDFWPIAISTIRPNTFGHTGVVGFHNPPVVDRFFPYGHSGATRTAHFDEWLIPVLRYGEHETSPLQHAPRHLLHAPWMLRRAALSVFVIACVGLSYWMWFSPAIATH